MCDIPVEIDGAEKIVRAIKTPFHLKKNKSTKLARAAFRPPPGTDEVSVMRHGYMGTNACRAKAKEIGQAAYVGMAALLAHGVRNAGAAVVDSRQEFCGHADIRHGIVIERDEPPSAEKSLALDQRIDGILRVTTYYPDPDSAAGVWTGVEI